MSPAGWSLTALAVVLAAVYVSWTAGRLDRLHARVDAAWAALDAALVRRAAAARALVPHLPPGAAAAALDRAAAAALRGGPVAREAVENDLTRALRTALPDLPARPTDPAGLLDLLEELEGAATRAGLTRSFHNSAVADARVLRRKRVPRALHLAGHRVLPQHFDVDDTALPAALQEHRADPAGPRRLA